MRQIGAAGGVWGVAAVVVLVWACAAMGGGTVVLKDGQRITGEIIEAGDQVGVATDGGMRMVPRDQVERIEYDAFGRATREQLASYKAAEREASQSAHPLDAVVVWKRYVDAVKEQEDNPLGEEGRRQLERWSEAVREKKVIWGGEMVTAAERDRRKALAVAKLSEAVEACRRGRCGTMVGTLRDALRNWPEHPGIEFYLGLALQKNRQPAEASAHYREALEGFPGHVPSLNNLAAIECTRKVYRAGAPLMIEASDAAPDFVMVIDNAQRTLLRMEEAKVRGLDSEMARLRNAGARMESVMRQQGMFRWGTSWVTQERLKEYEATNRQIDAQLEQLAAEIAAIEQDLVVLQARIVELERQRRSAPTEYDLVRDVDGDGVIDRVYPADTLTKEKIDLLLVEQNAKLVGKEQMRADKVAVGRKVREGRIVPPRDLEYVLIEEAGDEIMLFAASKLPPEPKVASLVGPTSAKELILAIRSGKAYIMADDGTFLGKASGDASDAQSILNASGMFGSATAEAGIMNLNSKYASADGDLSALNPKAAHPPKLLWEGRMLAYVTTNQDLEPRVSLADVVAVARGE